MRGFCSKCKLTLSSENANAAIFKRLSGYCRKCDAERKRARYASGYKRCRQSIKGRYRCLRERLRIDRVPLSDPLWSFNFYTALIQDATCHYCGSETLSLGGHSLDRVVNNIGHVCSNVVPCCIRCNSVKSNYFSYEEMMLLSAVLKAIREARG